MNTGANSYFINSKNRRGECEFLRWRVLYTQKRFADRQTPAKGGGFDVALISVDAYEPRWFMKDQHVKLAEVVQIHKDLKAKRSVGVHWDTFALTDEPLDKRPQDLTAAVTSQALGPNDFTLMVIGETRKLPAQTVP